MRESRQALLVQRQKNELNISLSWCLDPEPLMLKSKKLSGPRYVRDSTRVLHMCYLENFMELPEKFSQHDVAIVVCRTVPKMMRSVDNLDDEMYACCWRVLRARRSSFSLPRTSTIEDS